MGFMDRAKELAEQAQQRLDEDQRASHADAQRIAPPTLSSGDPLKRS